jgi:hypothetical protein
VKDLGALPKSERDALLQAALQDGGNKLAAK